MLRKRGTLSEIAATITDLTALTVQVGADPAPISKGKPTKSSGTPPALELPDLLDPGASGGSRVLNVSYEGPLRGLLIMWQSPAATGGISTPKQKMLFFPALSCGHLRFWALRASGNTKIRSPTNPGKRRAPASGAAISTRR